MKNILPSLLVTLAVIFSAVYLGNSYTYKFKKNQTVTVTGSAFYDFDSDLIVWSGQFSRKSMQIKDAYADLKSDEAGIRAYLTGKGIKESDIIFSSVNTNKDIEYIYDPNGGSRSIFTGYTLSQTVKIESKDLETVEKVSREITELLDKGIVLNSYEPQYYYTKLDELKIDLLARAAKDGEQRAKTILENSGSALGKLHKASMGIFQITGRNSNEDYSWGGAFNTSSKKKTASVTIKMDFSIR
jgi:hypothetical protein